MLLLVLLSGSTTSQPDYSLPNLVLMAVYVGLTLVLATVAVVSIVNSSRLSRDALAASDRQSREAIEAVQRRIDASERQSQAALALAREQIEQGKQPILIPLSPLPLTAVAPQLDYTQSDLPLELMNVGTGVALNIWGVLVPPKNIPRLPYAFRNRGHLLQDKKDTVVFRVGQYNYFFTEKDKIGAYDLWPTSELTQDGTTGTLRYVARLTLTYIDVFGNKHATIYDYTYANEQKFVAHFRVQHSLDDMYIEMKF